VRSQNKPHRRKLRKKTITLSIIAFILLLLVITPFVLLLVASESEPAVTSVAKADTDAAVKAKKLARKLRAELTSDAKEASLSISQQDVNGLIAIAMRGMKQFQGRVNTTPLGIEGAFSVHVPRNPLGQYLNIRFGVAPSTNGLHLNYLSVGSLHFSGDTALDVGEALVNMLAGDALGSHLRDSVKSVTVSGDVTTIVFRPIPDLNKRVALFRDRVKEVRDELALVANPAVVQVYYSELCRLGEDGHKARTMSLGYYMAQAYSLASKRTHFGGDPIEENRAALMALAIYSGSTRFESFVGEVMTDDLAHCVAYSRNTQLAQRTDLRLHFIYSAALKVLGDSGISFAIGEFKEMMDSGRGGSGFSFVDLSADRAGIRFAEVALDGDKGGAVRLQSMALNFVDESLFFPEIDGLPEGIPQAEFDSRYGGVDGPLYVEYVKEIDRRLNRVSLYNP
jgi:uncharacterized protein YfiM (DUF2279 family)